MKKSIIITLSLLMAVALQAQTVSFTAAEWATAQGLSDGASVTSYSQDGVTVTFAQGGGTSAPTWNAGKTAIAAVAGNTMTISASGDKSMTQVVLTMATSGQASSLASATWDSGTATASEKNVTWTGSAPTIQVAMTATEGFVSFSVSCEEIEQPFVEDVTKYNDSTTVSIAQWIADEWLDGNFDASSYSKEGKTITVNKEGEAIPSAGTDYIALRSGVKLTITAPAKMRKIIFKFGNIDGGRRWVLFNSGTQPSSGQLVEDETDRKTAIWYGQTAEVSFISGYNSNLKEVIIICDTTDNQVHVTFYDFDNQVLQTGTVLVGQDAIAPTMDDACFGSWDTDITNVHTDLEVHPQRAIIFSLTVNEWHAQNDVQPIIKDGYQISSNGGSYSDLTVTREGETYTGLMYYWGSIQHTIKSLQPFNNFTIICSEDSYAASLASGTWSSGTVVQEGCRVIWSGYTDSLAFAADVSEIAIAAYRIECKTITEYTVVFYDIDGNELKRDTVARGGSATAPTNMEQTGYTFVGWDTDFTNLGGDNPFIYVHPIYEEAEGYVLVTFVDLNGNVLQQSRVHIGSSVTAPTPPAVPLMMFIGWDHDLTNITEAVTIKPVYELDSNSPDILTLEQWNTSQTNMGDYYAVKGVVSNVRTSLKQVQKTGKMMFSIANEQTSLDILNTLNINSVPFFHNAQIQVGDTIIAYGQLGELDIQIDGYTTEHHVGLKDGYLLYHSTPTDRSNVFYLEMPDAQALYDFNGDGTKQVADLNVKTYVVDEQVPGCTCTHDNQDFIITATGSIAEGFSAQDTLIQHTFENIGELGYSSGDRILYIEDLNHDGKPDFSIGSVSFTSYSQGSVTGSTQLWMSKDMKHAFENGAFAITNMDLNGDGRLDYLIFKNSAPSPYGEIAYQTADECFVIETMEFVNNIPLNAPQVRKAKSTGNQVSLPMTAIDLNGDGLKDLVNEKDGVLYMNRGNGQWEWIEMGAPVIPTDLNNDGYTDFVMPSDALYTAIYNAAAQEYTITAINSAGMVDDTPFCYDFDKDGDIDILATFSAYNNSNVAYTSFFINDGSGHFTKQNEQNYGADSQLWFSECQDIDGDGYYDLLAFKGEILIVSYTIPFVGNDVTMYYESGAEIVWLRGGGNNSFAAPQRLYELTQAATLWHNFNASSYIRNSFALHLNAEDLDGNGATRIWVSGVNTTLINATPYNGTTEIYPVPAVTPNTRPTAPAVPQLTYDNGLLTVNWGNGTDDKTATADLTYALRIGTTSGGNDILAAHANADGSRRNFLDGNMGRAHSYTIDLRTYAPGKVYVAVQTIDAQHMGSVWSQEATVAHTYVPVAFNFSKNPIAFNETAEVHYTALPEDYTHTWRYADGTVVKDTTYLVLSFPSAGDKTITHIVTSPNGTQDSTTAVLTVLPAAVSAPIEVTIDVRNILARPLADYTFDGRIDGALDAVYEGVADSSLFKKALGMWNANTLSLDEVRWYDYDHDGDVDLLFNTPKHEYIYMPHDPAQPALTAQVNTERADNNRLMYLIGFSYTQYTTYKYFSFKEDMRHIGYEECAQSTLSGDGKTRTLELADFAKDGSVAFKPITVIGDAELFKKMVDETFYTADFDHDGFADIAGIGYTNNDYTFPELNLFYNRGNCVYEQGNIPFPEALPPHTTISLEDFNGDGYIDVLVYHNNTWDSNDVKFGRIYWNNANLSFTPMDLPNLNMTYENPNIITDVDNNGYKDVVAITENPALGNRSIYVWYMGAEGLQRHGSLAAVSTSTYDLQDIYLTPDDHRLMCSEHLYPIVAQADERPAAPTNIQATMTDEGLLLTWNAAIDDHTPAALMRYNLSMKLQGVETYLFSPQNGENENAAYIPGYNYINATQFLIPTSVLSNGNYEIRMQAVDKQNKMSLFSQTLIVHVARNPIEAPATTCAYDYTEISYMGTDQTGTPVWDFDGGYVSKGSGFGPYTVDWETSGEKVITLTLGDTTYRDTISVINPYDLQIALPMELYENIPYTVSLPAGVTCEWYAKVNDAANWCPVDATGILTDASYVLIYDRRLKAEGATITAYALPNETSLCDDKLELQFVFYTPEGCTGYHRLVVPVRPQANIPTLTLVTTNANGQNVISWSNTDAFNAINIYREGNSLNDFQLIGAVSSGNSYTDASSDATQKAERYYITGVSSTGESPASTIHQTVHLTINRGVANGTYNLIWNNYVGATVTGYSILRGESPTSLTQIATLASSNTSYTDQAPVDSQPYYAIEYVLASAAATPAANRVPATALSGRSNVVDRRNAEEGIEDIHIDPSDAPRKIMIDNVIYILRGDRVYTLQGQEVK